MELSLRQMTDSLFSLVPIELLLLVESWVVKFTEYLTSPPLLEEVEWIVKHCRNVLVTRRIETSVDSSGCIIMLYKDNIVFVLETIRPCGTSRIGSHKRKPISLGAYLAGILKNGNHTGTNIKRFSLILDIGTMFSLVKRRLQNDVNFDANANLSCSLRYNIIVRERVIHFLKYVPEQLGGNDNYIVKYLYHSFSCLNLYNKYYKMHPSKAISLGTARLIELINEMV